MRMSYINRIKGNISISTNKKTANVLDGSYKSIFKGKSLNFEDLRTYVIGDNVKDIDWKASARNNDILIKQFVAEKKHNMMFVLDSSKTMLADSFAKDKKYEVALYTAGTLAYLANNNGDYVAGLYSKENKINYLPFKQGLFNIEYILNSYETDTNNLNNSATLNDMLDYIINYIDRRMVIFIITDLSGIDSLEIKKLKTLALKNDILIININDNLLYDLGTYDIEVEEYIPRMFLKDEKLKNIEIEEKKKILKKKEKEFLKYKISTTSIDGYKEIVNKVVELLERHRYANTR